MSAINELSNLATISGSVNHSDQIKYVENKDRKLNPPADAELKNQDRVEISDAAKELLHMRLDARNYVHDVEEAQTLPETKIEELKQKITDKSLLNKNTIENIANKLTSLPNFI